MRRELIEELDEIIAVTLPQITNLRHTLHTYPEMAFEEVKTSAVIRNWLGDLSVNLWEPLIGTDVIAEIPGNSPQTICLRADIDALPICEINNLPYASAISGVMHACGHDGHVAMLLGAASALSAMQKDLPVNVRFVFQPGEEMVCGGKELVKRGACKDVNAVYALHGWPGLPTGVISSKPGVMFAAGSIFSIIAKGRGCHGAMPEKGKNPIPIIAKIIDKMHDLHKMLNKNDGSVITVCSVNAGSSPTVIPDVAVLHGTARYLSIENGITIIDEIKRILAGLRSDEDADIELTYTEEYNIPVINSLSGYQHAYSIVEKYMPKNKWIETEKPTMGMEDFAFYLQNREGAMLWLGLGDNSAPLHSTNFDFNDDVLATGIRLLCLLALGYKSMIN